MNYVETIKTAIIIFPFIAFFFTIPYILFQYHKYGSVHKFRTIIIYSFILYLIVAYFLIILPLPSIEEVLALKTSRTQLIPFQFIIDFFKNSTFQINDLATYFPSLKNAIFFQAFFNLLLTAPFGFYLHYYFKKDLKKTIGYTFLLSLFFELTQLSGLYFIYPRGYRLFDVDDLIINTLGGFLGYFIAFLSLKFLPTREEIDHDSYLLGSKVSFTKRITAFFLDLFFFLIFSVIIFTIIPNSFLTHEFIKKLILFFCFIIYYIIIPMIKKNQTFAQQFLNLKFQSIKKEETKKYQIIFYQLGYLFLYIISFPMVLSILNTLEKYHVITLFSSNILSLLSFGIYFFFFLISFLLKMMGKNLPYEKLSDVTLKSTINIKKDLKE